MSKILYLYRLSEDSCVLHDGYIQTGIMPHSIERHIELNPKIKWVETYWLPDIFKNRYKRASLQVHERKAGGKQVIESRPRDFPDEGAGRGLLPGQSG